MIQNLFFMLVLLTGNGKVYAWFGHYNFIVGKKTGIRDTGM